MADISNAELNKTRINAGRMVIFLNTPLSVKRLFHPIAISKPKIKTTV